MNRCFLQPARQTARKSAWCGLLVALALTPLISGATDETYVNYGAVTTPPVIDALNFINYGTFNLAGTLYAFETSNTRNYTNYGTLFSGTGWWFDTAPSHFGDRQMADNFDNGNGGTVQGGTYLWVDAKNIVNPGYMAVGNAGWIKLVGTNIDLSQGGLDALPMQGSASFNIDTNFIPATGIEDLYWGQTNFTMNSAGIWNGNSATSPAHPVAGGAAQVIASQPLVSDSFAVTNGGLMISVTNYIGTNTGIWITNINPSDVVITNVFIPTNVFRQAVFAGYRDPTEEQVQIHFSQAPGPPLGNPPFRTVAVEFDAPGTNPVTLLPENTTLYLVDTLASQTNRGLNFNLTGGGFRPANYRISRADTGEFGRGGPGQGPPDTSFLYNNTFSNNIVTADYAGYGANINSQSYIPPAIPAGTVTNLTGRVQIYADNLNLNEARVRGQGEVIFDTRHLVGTKDTVVDCENLSFDLGTTNGFLNVANLSKETVHRVQGPVYMWSGYWTNTFNYIYTNNWLMTNVMDTNGNVTATDITQEAITNSGNIVLYAFIVDWSGISTTVPVTVFDLVTHGENVTLSDNMNVVQSFLIDGKSLTIKGRLGLTSSFKYGTGVSLTDWVATNAPNLLYFTNSGSLSIPNNAIFGDDRPLPYSTFVNNGQLTASALRVNSDLLYNSGSLSVLNGSMFLFARSATLENGSSTANYNNLAINDLRLNHYTLNASGPLNLFVTNSFADAGPNSASTVTTMQGLNLPIKPNTGDLIGTTFHTRAPDFVKVPHTWAGQDRGADPSGYVNNVAVGDLQLGDVGRLGAALVFRGAGPKNGLYVDLLDLTNLGTNYLTQLQIDPSLTIYYAAARLSFTPPPTAAGIPQEPEEFLNGQFGGRLQWVSSFAGPRSSTPVIVNGQTVLKNTALVNSKLIDSDGDGVPNYFDSTPFGGTTPNPGTGSLVLSASLVNTGVGNAKAFAISWDAAPNAIYQIDVSPSLTNPQWQPFTRYTNGLPSAAQAKILDTNAGPGVLQRYYRVQLAK